MDERVIRELIEKGYNIAATAFPAIRAAGSPAWSFIGKIPDNTDDIRYHKGHPQLEAHVLLHLKNDHNCRFMGFGLTREQQRYIDAITKEVQQSRGDGG